MRTRSPPREAFARLDDRGVPLSLPFACLALAGVAAVVSLPGMGHPSWWSTLIPVLAGAALGAMLGRVRAGWMLKTVLGTLAASVSVFAVLVGILAGRLPEGLILALIGGTLLGAVTAVPIVPGALLLVASAQRARRARRGSTLWASDQRGVWVVALVAAAWTSPLIRGWLSLWNVFGFRGLGGTRSLSGLWFTGWVLAYAPLVVAIAATSIVGGLLVLDVLASLSFERLVLGLGSLRPRPSDSAPERPTVDIGVGDTVFEELVPSTSPYRSTDLVARLVRGDPALAERLLDGMLVQRAVLFLAGTVAIAVTPWLATVGRG